MNSKLITVTLTAAMTALSLMSCASGTKNIVPQKSVAIFDSFKYQGNDDYYNQHPLADRQTFYNPILAGWYSDPSICTNGNGDYFLVTSTFTYFPGVPIFHSRDLVNWKQIGHVLARESQLLNMEKQHVSGGIFAPDIAYNPANKTYYMITTNVGHGNFFVKTQDPFGEWSDPIMLPEVQGIDPAFFFDDNGKAYIVNNDDAPDGNAEYDGHRTVRVVEFDTVSDKCVGERKIVVNKGVRPEEKPIWCEGPHIYKIDGEYFLMTAEGGTSVNHSEVIYRGPSPFGPFKPWEGNPILTQRNLDRERTNPVTCAGHADLVKDTDGRWWGVFLAVRPMEGDHENLGRETFMLPVRWTEDGWPYLLSEGEEVPMQVRKDGVTRSDDMMSGNYSRNEEFNDSSLGMEWMTLRGPATDYYSLTSTPGCLSIKCVDVHSTEKAVLPFVGRRINHHKYSAETDLTFIPENAGESAGMLLMKDESHQYFLGRALDGNGGHKVVARRISDQGSEELGSIALSAEIPTVDLKVESKGRTLDFLCSCDGGKNWEKVAEGIDACFTSTATAGGFTGTVLGLYASGLKTDN